MTGQQNINVRDLDSLIHPSFFNKNNVSKRRRRRGKNEEKLMIERIISYSRSQG